MVQGRSGAACGSLKWEDPATGIEETIVVVVGGAENPTTEFLFLDQDLNVKAPGWVAGPPLPGSHFKLLP